jgi:xanthine dehydrogenase accessory factor
MEFAFIPDESPYLKLLEFMTQKKPAALATVIGAEGSTPQVAGASALFSREGLVCGTIGGGFLEAEAERIARRAIQKGESRLRVFNLAKNDFEEADGVCGGKLTVLIDARPERNGRAFREIAEAWRHRRAGVLATFIEQGRGIVRNLVRSWIPFRRKPGGHLPFFLPDFEDRLRQVVAFNRPILTSQRGRRLYLEPHLPPSRLVIAGAGHVGRAAARLGAFLGFDIVVIDDRPEFATTARFPEGGKLIVGNIAGILGALPVSPETYIVIVTRGHRHDEAALRACIRRRAAYIGLIGSRHKVVLMKERFLKKGWATPKEWNRVHTPIGLPIGSKTVEEIAVSIASELVLVRSMRKKA